MKNIIIIPYRERQEHLNYWIKHSYPKLNNTLENLEVIIVEQCKDGKLFNRGKIINIGFHYYNNEEYNYFTHDVDINPISENIIKIYNRHINHNEIMGIYTSSYNTLGGIIKFKGSTFKKINGFINNYWGWGSEDKNLQNRAEFFNIKISKNILNNDKNKNKIFKIFNDNHKREQYELRKKTNFEYNLFKNLSKQKKLDNVMKNGLNNLEYNILRTTPIILDNKVIDNIKMITVEI